MAESKFLKYQDYDRDNLIDVCEIDLGPPEQKVCKDCVPNPKALVPNWKTSESLRPFLNEKLCFYQIPMTTPETTTGADSNSTEEEAEAALQELYAKYADEAISSFLDFYDKADNTSNKQIMVDNIEYRDYFLEVAPSSRLQLLYSFPFEILSLLEEIEDDEEEEEEAEEDITVEYIATEMQTNMIRIRKGLNLYSRYEKVYRFTDGGSLRFIDTGGLFNLDNYGDLGILRGKKRSITSKLVPDLEEFLNDKGFNIPGVGGFGGLFEDEVLKLQFTFTPEYRLKKLKVYTQTCGEKPKVFNSSRLKSLNKKESWRDRTAVAYFAQMRQMERDLTARTPQPWLEFVKQYTYPQVDAVINAGYTNTDPDSPSALTCIADNLAAEGKQLGQDILDDAFGLGDAIASQFHKMLCNRDYKEMIEQKIKFGQIPSGALAVAAQGRDVALIDADKFVPNGKDDEASKNIGAFAIEQAFKELDETDQVFSNFCALILSGFSASGDTTRQLDILYADGFDKIRICGLFDLMLDAIQCLFKGLTLEEALSSMLRSALTSMSLENFGDLFVGLPPDKQQELDALVQKKLNEGNIFPAGSSAQRISDEAAKGENARIDIENDTSISFLPKFKKPWENPDLINEQNEKLMREGPYESISPSGIPPAKTRKSDVGDATVKAQLQNVGSELNPNSIMQAYIAALLEVYSDNLLELLDLLNRFPGAEIIAKVIALIDCPMPPIFDPSMTNFLKDIELPFCRNTAHIGLPRLENPFAYLPKIKDIFRLLFMILRIEVQKLVVRIIIKLIVKVCELIGNAICKALEAVGDLAAALPAIATGRSTFKEVIRETICGPEADDEKIDDTIVDMFQKMGAGGAAFADRAAVMSFAEDLSASTTQLELSNAIVGDPSETFLSVVQSLIEFEYPQFGEAFNNRENISSFFSNIGNLMPADAKQVIKDFVRGLDEDDGLPANPTLCATPQQIEDFCSLRAGLLEGRASPDQIANLCESTRNTFKDDLEDISTILNDGVSSYLENNLPPIVSDPGCNNGLVPFEPDEIIKATTNALDGNMEALKIAYTYDMIGNGPGERNWGFMNMVLSDTSGNPYTAHLRKSGNSGGFLFKRKYVDFYVQTEEEPDANDDTNFAAVKRQQGAFPNYVADWLITTDTKTGEMERQFKEANFKSSNAPVDNKVFKRTFENLGFDGFFGSVNLLTLPDFGYNVDMSVDFDDESIKFNRRARKKTADISLKFRDNAKGTADEGGFSYGFNLKMYLSDIEKSDGNFVNPLTDNARVVITNVVNTGAKVDAADGAYENEAEDKKKNSKSDILKYRAYEFVSADGGLDGVDLLAYPRFSETASNAKKFIPQVYMLQDIIEKAGSTPPNAKLVKDKHDQIMTAIFEKFAEEVYTNLDAFKYGAAFDDLSYDDISYGVVNDSGVFVEYSRYADINDLSNEDAVLGVSRDQYLNDEAGTPEKTRVFYLDPAKHGGNYFNPPIYIKPEKNSGWLGFVDVMFPEMSPCKPYRSDAINFGSIQERINSTYSRIPEDDRLRSDPDCIREEPYNRILERPAKAGIEGLISAAIRIYASVHLLKASATFSKFKPDFYNTFSSLYPQYIIEKMEEDFKNAQPSGFFEFFNPFKDEEFWYSFLEQSVQTYARRYADDQLDDPPAPVVDALNRIQEVIAKYRRIIKKTYQSNDDRTIVGLRDAKKMGDAGRFETLKNYRYEKNLELVRETEEDAKIILQELVKEEMQFMGDIYLKNMQETGLASDNVIEDLRKYVLEKLCVGSTLDIDKEIKQQVQDIDATGAEAASNLYTAGGTLITEQGDDYVGYYHIHIDEAGDSVYMVGPYHVEESHDVLKVSANKITVPIGDVSDISTSNVPTSEKPFVLEKYVRINDIYYTPGEAQAIITAAGTTDTNISDVYPGTMELVYDENGAEIGVTGELGVRYGLRLSTDAGNGKQTLVETEVDALDLPVTQFQPLEADSKLLLCLVNNLLDEPDFNAVAQYVFPLNKILSVIAIYNDMAFVPSIGETVIDKKSKKIKNVEDKPGRYIVVSNSTGVDADGDTVSVTKITTNNGADGWQSAKDRAPGIFAGNGLFLLHYDKWDQDIFMKSKFRIKKLFKNFYNSRDFDPNDDDSDSVGEVVVSQLSAAFRPASGKRLLPWWKKRMLRTNPFNADGALCDKKD